MEPIHEFTLMWGTRPEVRELRAIHHSLTSKPSIGLYRVSETVIRPIRNVLARVGTDQAQNVLQMIDSMLSQMSATAGYDRFADVNEQMAKETIRMCNEMAMTFCTEYEKDGKSIHPSVDVDIEAIIATRRGRKTLRN